jgi:hypothetical protein
MANFGILTQVDRNVGAWITHLAHLTHLTY